MKKILSYVFSATLAIIGCHQNERGGIDLLRSISYGAECVGRQSNPSKYPCSQSPPNSGSPFMVLVVDHGKAEGNYERDTKTSDGDKRGHAPLPVFWGWFFSFCAGMVACFGIVLFLDLRRLRSHRQSSDVSPDKCSSPVADPP